MRTAKASFLFLVVGGMCMFTLAQGGEPTGRLRSSNKPQQEESVTDAVLAAQSEFARLNAVLLDDGYWAIAGVVELNKDAAGRIAIKVKKDGDFDRDMVLTLPVPLLELDTGEIVVAGITAASVGSDTLTLYMEDVTAGGIASRTRCVMTFNPTLCVKVACTGRCTLSGVGGHFRCDCGAIAAK